MEIVKKIGLWLAYVIATVMNIPLVLANTLVFNAALWHKYLAWELVWRINNEAVTEGWNRAMAFNIKQHNEIIELCEDLEL